MCLHWFKKVLIWQHTLFILVTPYVLSSSSQNFIRSFDGTCSIIIPEGWGRFLLHGQNSSEDNPEYVLGIIKPLYDANDYFQESVLIERYFIDNQIPLNNYITEILEYNISNLAEFRVLDSGNSYIGGLNARWYHISYTVLDSSCVMAIMFLLVKNNWIYNVICTDCCETFPFNRNELESIANSVTFKEQFWDKAPLHIYALIISAILVIISSYILVKIRLRKESGQPPKSGPVETS